MFLRKTRSCAWPGSLRASSWEVLLGTLRLLVLGDGDGAGVILSLYDGNQDILWESKSEKEGLEWVETRVKEEKRHLCYLLTFSLAVADVQCSKELAFSRFVGRSNEALVNSFSLPNHFTLMQCVFSIFNSTVITLKFSSDFQLTGRSLVSRSFRTWDLPSRWSSFPLLLLGSACSGILIGDFVLLFAFLFGFVMVGWLFGFFVLFNVLMLNMLFSMVPRVI